MSTTRIGYAGVFPMVGFLLRFVGFAESKERTLLSEPAECVTELGDSQGPADKSTAGILESVTPRQIPEAAAQRNRLMREFLDDYYNPTYRKPAYLRKLARHDTIQTFTTSSRRIDRRFRNTMVFLLRSGYSVDK